MNIVPTNIVPTTHNTKRLSQHFRRGLLVFLGVILWGVVGCTDSAADKPAPADVESDTEIDWSVRPNNVSDQPTNQSDTRDAPDTVAPVDTAEAVDTAEPDSCVEFNADCEEGECCEGLTCFESGGGSVCLLICEEGFASCDGEHSSGCEVDLSTGEECVCVPGESSPCFEGDPEMEGVGACSPGIKTCGEGGTAWGECVGEGVPSPEVCGDGIDQDCNGILDDAFDIDGDGFDACHGDCCEEIGGVGGCAEPALVNPGAYDFPNGVDDDCDGVVDNPSVDNCSVSEDFFSTTGAEMIEAMDLCQTTVEFPEDSRERTWGVISVGAFQANGSGAPNQVQTGVLLDYGVNTPRKNATMAAISSGSARDSNDPGFWDPESSSYVDFFNTGSAPSDYTTPHGGQLQSAPGCPGGDASSTNDMVEIRLRVRVPTNALSFSYDFKFYSAEYSQWSCSSFNDFFLALYYSEALSIPDDHNISFDASHNPVSVNNAFFTVCEPIDCYDNFSGTDLDIDGCPDSMFCDASNECATELGACIDGTGELQNTGMPLNTAGGTAWLTTSAPVVPGEIIELHFFIWDTGDHTLDSLVLLDNFIWSTETASIATK